MITSRYEVFANEIIKFISKPNLNTIVAMKHANNMLKSIQFGSTAMGADVKQLTENQINNVIKNINVMTEEEFKELLIICNKFGIKLEKIV